MNMSKVLIPLAALALVAAPASAATPAGTDAVRAETGWSAWLGCWRPMGDDAPLNAMVCVVPGEAAGSVRMISLEDGSVAGEAVLHADGTPRRVEDGGCTGSERAVWSQDGRRVFLRTELDCDGVRRVSTGVLAMIAENEWVDIQAMEVAGQHATRSVRYRAVRADQVPEAVASLLPAERSLVREAARLHASAPLEAADVVEATSHTAAPVLEALIAMRQRGFGLNARTLVELERQGVPASVLDMMIAVSYPQRFAVQESSREPRMEDATWARPGAAAFADCRDPYTYRRLTRLECERLALYGYGSGLGYGYGSNRFGYSPWGYDPYGWRYGSQPIVVIVQPEREERQGQMVRGQGYTAPAGSSSSGRSAQPRTEPARPAAGSSGAAAPASATSGSGSSTSGESTGRRAVPRPTTGGGGGDGGGDEKSGAQDGADE
jgi:hypothetical protein